MNTLKTKSGNGMFMLFLFSILALALPEMAAANGGPLDSFIVKVLQFLCSNLVRTIAIIAIIAIALAAIAGRLQWQVVIVIACGILVLVSAPAIISWISGKTIAYSEGPGCT